jgi:hypothetical protein
LQSAAIPVPKLILMLIEETELTFKRGVIVTAQVVKVFEGQDSRGGNASQGFVLCKLDSGLDAKIEKQFLDGSDRRIEDIV